MPTYRFVAIGENGRRTRGTLNASSTKEARRELRKRGLFVESVRDKMSSKVSWGSKQAEPGVTSKPGRLRCQSDLTLAVRELATLLSAGVPLPDALSSLIDASRGRFHDSMTALHDAVVSGQSLADAMTQDPQVFDQMLCGMVRVGEEAGNLDEVFSQVADFRERHGQLKDRVLSAVLYPVIVMIVACGVTVFLMTVVVPMLLQNLTEMGRPLPWPTKILRVCSDTLRDYGWGLCLGVAAVVAVILISLRYPRSREVIDRSMLRVPILGTLIRKQALSRMALVISSLLRSGIELVDAMRIAASSTSNRSLGRDLESMCRDLESGRNLKAAAQDVNLFTPAVVQVMVLGQQSGKLEDMLERLGNDYDRQVGVLATRLTTVLEPILIVLLSVIVGFILFATVLPILEAGNVLAV